MKLIFNFLFMLALVHCLDVDGFVLLLGLTVILNVMAEFFVVFFGGKRFCFLKKMI